MIHYNYVVCDRKNEIYHIEIRQRENRMTAELHDILTWSNGDGEMKEWTQNEMRKKRRRLRGRRAEGDI